MANRAAAKVTTDHDEIRQWAEERGARPSCVRGTGSEGDIGMLRLDFPGYSGENSLTEISWDDWFDKFDERGLALLHQDSTARGQKSNFNKIISRETAEARAEGDNKASVHRGRTRSTSSRGSRSASKGRSTSSRGRSARTSSGTSRSRRSTSAKSKSSRSGRQESEDRRRETRRSGTDRRRSASAKSSTAKRASSTFKRSTRSSRSKSAQRNSGAKRSGGRKAEVKAIRGSSRAKRTSNAHGQNSSRGNQRRAA